MSERRNATTAPPRNGGEMALSGRSASVATILNHPQTLERLKAAVPKHVDPGRFLRVVLTEVRRTPKLAECDPTSFMGALMVAGQIGLEPGPFGYVYFLPFWNGKTQRLECNLILGYKGIIDLAWRSGQLVSLVAREVRKNDHFDFHYGSNEDIDHRPLMEGDRGETYAYYAIANFKDGGRLLMVLTRDDVERYRQRSQAKDTGPWKTDYDAMACKTVIRRMQPFLRLSAEMAQALAVSEAHELGLEGGVIDGLAESVAIPELSAEEQTQVAKLNALLPGEQQLQPPALARLREEGGFDTVNTELRKRLEANGYDPETGEKKKAEKNGKPKDEEKAEAQPEKPAQAEQPQAQKPNDEEPPHPADSDNLPLGR